MIFDWELSSPRVVFPSLPLCSANFQFGTVGQGAWPRPPPTNIWSTRLCSIYVGHVLHPACAFVYIHWPMATMPGYYRELSVPHRELSSPQCCGEITPISDLRLGVVLSTERFHTFQDDIAQPRYLTLDAEPLRLSCGPPTIVPYVHATRAPVQSDRSNVTRADTRSAQTHTNSAFVTCIWWWFLFSFSVWCFSWWEGIRGSCETISRDSLWRCFRYVSSVCTR